MPKLLYALVVIEHYWQINKIHMFFLEVIKTCLILKPKEHMDLIMITI